MYLAVHQCSILMSGHNPQPSVMSGQIRTDICKSGRCMPFKDLSVAVYVKKKIELLGTQIGIFMICRYNNLSLDQLCKTVHDIWCFQV